MVTKLLTGLSLVVLIFLLQSEGAAKTMKAAPPENWQVVLAAGDDAQPVFDNATRALSERLIAAGVPPANIHRLSASTAELSSNVEPASAKVLLRRIAELPVRPGDQCLIFLTSHGEPDGVWLARSNAALSPNELADALSRGCRAAPTVVLISACYSGGFVTGKMAKPNRVVLTAARADRPSFGCQAHRTYNFFDECLLTALPKSATWRAEFNGARMCVRHMEQAFDERPSEPQAYFGAAVTDLPVGF
jgi:Peptidase C13 family